MKKIIILFIMIIFLCGCSRPKCVKSHEERTTCVYYSYQKVGAGHIMIPHHYKCTQTICDQYENVSDNKEK